MEFEMLIQNALESNLQICSLREELQQQLEKCRRSVKEPLLCEGKTKIFVSYLNEYTRQFSKKGQDICKQSFRVNTNINQFELQDMCIRFYAKGLPLFQQNVRSKIRSLLRPKTLQDLQEI